MSEPSFWISALALIISVIAVSYTRRQFNLAAARDRREQELKVPSLDIIPTQISPRRWKLEIRLKNRSDERIVPIGCSIPVPKGGYISMRQTAPEGEPVQDIQINSGAASTYVGRAIPPGETGIWIAGYEIGDAFPAKPGTELWMIMNFKYLGRTERTDKVTVLRQIN